MADIVTGVIGHRREYEQDEGKTYENEIGEAEWFCRHNEQIQRRVQDQRRAAEGEPSSSIEPGRNIGWATIVSPPVKHTRMGPVADMATYPRSRASPITRAGTPATIA